MRQYAISDIHGCADTFIALLSKIGFNKEDELYLLGDLIDRGPKTKELINEVLQLRAQGYFVECLLGNHEALMLEALQNQHAQRDLWLQNGGAETLESYFQRGIPIIPSSHLDFFERLHFYKKIPGYILVHAGLNFYAQDPFSDKEAMLWIRGWYRNLDRQWLGEQVIVHGHTPIPTTQITKSLENLKTIPILNIDAGCVYKGREEFGNLCAFDLTHQVLFFQENIDR